MNSSIDIQTLQSIRVINNRGTISTVNPRHQVVKTHHIHHLPLEVVVVGTTIILNHHHLQGVIIAIITHILQVVVVKIIINLKIKVVTIKVGTIAAAVGETVIMVEAITTVETTVEVVEVEAVTVAIPVEDMVEVNETKYLHNYTHEYNGYHQINHLTTVHTMSSILYYCGLFM